MTQQKIHADIDGTLLFEEFCLYVLKLYIGPGAEGMVLGTQAGAKFKDKINKFCELSGIGGAFKNRDQTEPSKNDDRIDVMVWKDFYDRKENKLLAVGQCKTGTSWLSELPKFNPNLFLTTWLDDPPTAKAIPAFMVADVMNDELNSRSQQGRNILFDRFRIMEYVDATVQDCEFYARMKIWTDAALESIFD